MEPQPTTSHTKLITWLIVAIVVMMVVYGFYSSYSTKPAEPNPATNITTETESVVLIRHQYKNGKHTFIGEIDLPNPCYSVSTEKLAAQKGSYTLNIKTKTTSAGCITVVTAYPFKITVEAAKLATFTFTKDGAPFRYTIVEAGAAEDLEKFDPYVKG
jgi:hypothetical protein